MSVDSLLLNVFVLVMKKQTNKKQTQIVKDLIRTCLSPPSSFEI